MRIHKGIIAVITAALLAVAVGLLVLFLLMEGDTSPSITPEGARDSRVPDTPVTGNPETQPPHGGGEEAGDSSEADGDTEKHPDPGDKPVLVRGRVVDSHRAPVVAAHVVLTEEFGWRSFGWVLREGFFLNEESLNRVFAETETDGNGEFSFPEGSVPSRRFCVRASAPGFATGMVHVFRKRTAREKDGIEIVLKSPASLSGNVKDEFGNSVAGAVVVATKDVIPATGGRMGMDLHWAVTGNGGNFRIRDLPAGRYRLKARKGCTLSKEHRLRVPREGEIEIVVPLGFVLYGVVKRADTGEPVPGVKVGVERQVGGSRSWQAECGEDGFFRFENLPPGTYTVEVQSNLHSAEALTVEGAGSERLERGFAVDCGISLTGVVRDANTGSPVSGVRISAEDGGESYSKKIPLVETESRADGTFTLTSAIPRKELWDHEVSEWTPIEESVVELIAYKKGWRQEEARVVAFPDGVHPAGGQIVLLLVQMARASGRVSDASGKGLAGVMVISHSARKRGGDVCMGTDGEGAFRVFVDTGPGNYLVATHPNYAFGFHRLKNLAPGQEVQGVEIRLTAGGALEGSLFRDDGTRTGCERILLQYVGPAGGERPNDRLYGSYGLGHKSNQFQTDGDGKFVKRRLRPGIWKVSFLFAPQYMDPDIRVVIREGETARVRIPMRRPPFTIEGVVVDDSGTPMPLVAVIAHGENFSSGITRGKEDGTFKIEGLRAGEYKVIALHPEYECDPIENVPTGRKGLRIVMRKKPRDRNH